MNRLCVLICLVTSVLGNGEDTSTKAQCGENEVYSETKIVCPPQSCESIYTSYLCANREPEPGCNCIDGYLRDADNKCILSENCPLPGGPIPVPPEGCNGDPNAEYRECTGCQGSCDRPNPICTAVCRPPGCQCKNGYVLSNGKCILLEQCPAESGCNGDPNAIKTTCPNPCPATCSKPEPGPCSKLCIKEGCQCKPGYLLYKGKCILPNKCPGGVKCPANERFAPCKIGCPTNYCPVDDRRSRIICDPRRPCPAGCICKVGYLRKSRKDPRCIKASRCPPVKCTRPNEVWSRRPPACLRESCEDLNGPSVPCDKRFRDYTPKCICKKGYCRDSSNVCVPVDECDSEYN